MKVEGSYTFDAPRERVWSVLLNPDALKNCVPGCESMTLTGEDQYDVSMKVGVAAIRGAYKGKIRISEKVEPSSYTMLVEGSGPQGQVSGTGKLELIEEGGGTRVVYKGDANVRGTLARVGARVIQPAAKTIAAQFFERMESYGLAKK